ncbi:MAG TPA: PLD nuclease N-terminal domain-containing protein [Candidatus Methanoperedens sp.]
MIGASEILLILFFPVFVFTIIFWFWMLVDCLKRPGDKFKIGGTNAKLIWILVIIFTGLIGALIYYFLIKGTGSPQDRIIGVALIVSVFIVIILIASQFVINTKTTVSIEPYPSGKLPQYTQKENLQTPAFPNVIIIVDSYNPPAYKGSSTLVTLAISGNEVMEGTEISLDYKTQIWRFDGSWEENPETVHLTPEQKPLVFQRMIKSLEQPEGLYSNLTVSVDKDAVDGEYYVTISGKGKGLNVESAVLSFRIGKGGKFPLPDKSVWNVGYIIPTTLSEEERATGSSSLFVGFTDAPPLSEEEKEAAIAIAGSDPSLKGESYDITGVISGFYDSQNYSGFFPVVTLDIGEQDKPGTIMSYIIDLDEKKAIGTAKIPRKPVPQEPTMMKRPPYITAITTAVQPDSGGIGTNVIITGSGFTVKNNSVAFELMPDEASTAGYKVGYINNLKSYDGKTIEFVIPYVLSACLFPLPETAPFTGCQDIDILFKPGTKTYPVFVVNQNGTSNSVNFTMS